MKTDFIFYIIFISKFLEHNIQKVFNKKAVESIKLNQEIKVIQAFY